MSRETAYSALFQLLQTLKASGRFKTCERKLRLLDDMKPPEVPALFMGVDHQKVRAREGAPPLRTLGAKLFLYAANPDKHTSAAIVLNGLIDAVEAALAPSPAFPAQTLGGAVRHAWIEGEIEVFEGVLGERAAAIVPIQMLMP